MSHNEAHVASLRWSESPAPLSPPLAPPPPPPLEARPLAAGPAPAVTLVQRTAAAAPLQVLAPGADLNLPPPNYLQSSALAPGPTPASVLRERDWGETDLFSSLRTQFPSSGLAGIGGVSPVSFIAPVDHMKRLITLPYTPGRVAFPVHRVGNSLVIDGGINRSGRGAPSGVAGDAAQRTIEDALGRMIGVTPEKPAAPTAPAAATPAAAAPSAPAAAAAPSSAALVAHRRPSAELAAAAAAAAATERLVAAADAAAADAADGWSMVGKKKNRSKVRDRNLYSKFLYHSVGSSDGGGEQRAPTPELLGGGSGGGDLIGKIPSYSNLEQLGLEATQRERTTGERATDSPPAGAPSAEPPPATTSAAASAVGSDTRWTYWTPKAGSAAADAPAEADEAAKASASEAAQPSAGAGNSETRWTFWGGGGGTGGGGEGGGGEGGGGEGSGGGGEGGGEGGSAKGAQQKGALSPRLSPHMPAAEPAPQTTRISRTPTGATQAGGGNAPPHPFRQVVHWQLRDLGMLLGTDQVVFSSAEYPAMSLQLCDLNRPIRPLSIIDFWLDNVMAAIPALAVCGHVDGMVKGYQVLKTDDLPHWPGAAFDANAVLDNAHALLSFLQAHCTRPGGSYWVLKEPEANLVRVFDLETLASEYGGDANPFAHSVALVCFRMAQRDGDDPPKGEPPKGPHADLFHRRELLLQCVELLDRAQHPLLYSLVQLQLSQCYAALGVDAGAVHAHADVAALLAAAQEAMQETDAAAHTPTGRELARRPSVERRPSSELIDPLVPPPSGRGRSPSSDLSAQRAAPPPAPPLGVSGLLQLLRWLEGGLPQAVWPQAVVLSHLLEGLSACARLRTPSAEKALNAELPEVELTLSRHRAELAFATAGCCLDLARALCSQARARPPRRRRLLASSAALALLRTGAHALMLHVLGAEAAAWLPACTPPPSPLRTFPWQAATSPTPQPELTEMQARGLLLVQQLAQTFGDAQYDVAQCGDGGAEGGGDGGGGPGTAAELDGALAPMRAWLAASTDGADGEVVAATSSLLPPPAVPVGEAMALLRDACASYWWSLLVSTSVSSARGGVAPAAPWRAACEAEAAARRAGAVRRLGAMLNETGQMSLRRGELSAADAVFVDGLAAFAEAADHANSALLHLNRAAVEKQRAARHAAAHAAAAAATAEAQRSLAASGDAAAAAAEAAARDDGAGGGAELPERGELEHLLIALDHQRAARKQLGQLKGGAPSQLRAMVLGQLAAGEAAAGGAMHAIIADRGGSEESIKRAGECLSRAQGLYEELGELAQVMLMMRRQGSLYLAAALCEELRGAGHERAASSRLTLALRHYDRALAPQLLAQAAASPAMVRCAAEARLELANFYLQWGGGGTRIKHCEAALGHARAARQPTPAVGPPGAPTPPSADASHSVPRAVAVALAEAEQRALRELIRLHAGSARAASLKEEYRELLKEAASGEIAKF